MRTWRLSWRGVVKTIKEMEIRNIKQIRNNIFGIREPTPCSMI
jgi:hypothetical protein